jgi:thioesterase domain-containing protein
LIDLTDPWNSKMTPEQDAAARFLEHELLSTIPLTRGMQLRVVRFAGAELELAAPLAPNVNDKGCAFGGSMASLMTLASWGLARLVLRERGFDPDIYVQDSHIDYLAPVWTELRICARAQEGHSLADFVSMYAARGKARISLCAEVDVAGQAAARLSARFVAKRREEKTA